MMGDAIIHGMEPSQSNISRESDKVISPFAQSEVAVSRNKGSGGKLFLIIGISLILIVGGAIAGVFIMRYLNDPYRTLENFPVAKYLDSYQSLTGSKFKANFHVEADLGWKDGAGRLMLFSTTEDSRPIAVLIPAAVAKDIYFTKGQTYIAEVEVKEGGLIYANSCQKN
jgi:hypothetical protein